MKFNEINSKNIKITQEFARLHAHICGDGYIEKTYSKRSEKSLIDHPRKNLIHDRYYVRYVNKENILVNQFIKDVKSVFGRKVTKLRRFEYEVCGKWIYDIFYNPGALKSYNWFIPSRIMNSNKLVKKEWLKAIFDDEGYIAKNQIELGIVNKKAINQIQKLLKNFKIKTKLYKPYIPKNPKHRIVYRISIQRENVLKYFKCIGFSHNQKRKKLLKLVNKISGTAGI